METSRDSGSGRVNGSSPGRSKFTSSSSFSSVGISIKAGASSAKSEWEASSNSAMMQATFGDKGSKAFWFGASPHVGDRHKARFSATLVLESSSCSSNAEKEEMASTSTMSPWISKGRTICLSARVCAASLYFTISTFTTFLFSQRDVRYWAWVHNEIRLLRMRACSAPASCKVFSTRLACQARHDFKQALAPLISKAIVSVRFFWINNWKEAQSKALA